VAKDTVRGGGPGGYKQRYLCDLYMQICIYGYIFTCMQTIMHVKEPASDLQLCLCAFFCQGPAVETGRHGWGGGSKTQRGGTFDQSMGGGGLERGVNFKSEYVGEFQAIYTRYADGFGIGKEA
jgi:hypothetical protein